ncbi:MAG: hypothetical protein HOP30_01360 [Cyclobacteriaceae bacterium]|nr:hypothetical protein [Cyclobacteriaceae bacterium]
MKGKRGMKKVNKNWMLGLGLGVALISLTILASGNLQISASLPLSKLKNLEQRLHELPKIGQTLLHLIHR